MATKVKKVAEKYRGSGTSIRTGIHMCGSSPTHPQHGAAGVDGLPVTPNVFTARLYGQSEDDCAPLTKNDVLKLEGFKYVQWNGRRVSLRPRVHHMCLTLSLQGCHAPA